MKLNLKGTGLEHLPAHRALRILVDRALAAKDRAAGRQRIIVLADATFSAPGPNPHPDGLGDPEDTGVNRQHLARDIITQLLAGPDAAEFYSPTQARDQRGRWSAVGAEHYNNAREHVRYLQQTGGVKPHHGPELSAMLQRLTVKQLHALKSELGLKASAPNKAALAAKLHERLSNQPGTVKPPARLAPKPAPAKPASRPAAKAAKPIPAPTISTHTEHAVAARVAAMPDRDLQSGLHDAMSMASGPSHDNVATTGLLFHFLQRDTLKGMTPEQYKGLLDHLGSKDGPDRRPLAELHILNEVRELKPEYKAATPVKGDRVMGFVAIKPDNFPAVVREIKSYFARKR